MNLAIIVSSEILDRCTGKGCLNAFFKRSDAFADYNKDVRLIAFPHDGGTLKHKIDNLKQSGVDVVHRSSCNRAKRSNKETPTWRLAQDFRIVG